MSKIALYNLVFLSIVCNCFEVHTECIEKVLGGAIQPPKFAAAEITYQSPEYLIDILQPIINKRLEATHYDRITASLHLSDHLTRSSNEPLESLKTFRYDLDFSRGGPCIPLTLDLLAWLPTEIKGYVVAARLPKKYQQFGFPFYCHAAILIKYQNPSLSEERGYIILDPSFDFPIPIHIRERG